VTVVVDADVLIGALDASDPHHRAARTLFNRWHRSGTPVLVSAVNLSEVLVVPAADRRRLRQARTAIAPLGVAVHGPGEAIAVEAARLRQLYPISLPDAYCVATAGFLGAALASFDQKVTRAARAEGTATASQRRS
jgi:predicted nucleic acid-binding protein